jgi:hypothetical protein
MGTWTLSNFENYLSLRMGNSDSWTDYYRVWVNSAYKYLCSLDTIPGTKKKLTFPDLDTAVVVPTVDGQTYIPTPNDCLFVNEIYDRTNLCWLDWIPYNQYASKTDTTTATAEGKPTMWVRRGDYIFIYPTPDAAYNLAVDYRSLPTSMSGDGDYTSLSTEWDNVILELAVFTARNWVGEPEKAKVAKDLAMEMAAGICDVYNNEEKARRESVRPDPAFHSRGQGY